MTEETEVVVGYCGVEITVSNKYYQKYSVFFRNLPGFFEPLNDVKALRGFSSVEAGIEAGKKFVDAHRWELIEKVGIYSLYVRLWWNEKWGYSVRSEGSSGNEGDFKTRQETIEAGRAYATEKIKEYEAM